MSGLSSYAISTRFTIVLLAGTGLVGACDKKQEVAPTPRPALTVAVTPVASTRTWSLPAQIVAPEATPVSFRISGKLVSRHAKVGDSVDVGHVLARLDPTPLQQSSESAQAQRQAAEQNLAFAKQQLDRDTKQARADLIAQAQLEQSRNAYAQAQAAYAQAVERAELTSDQLAYAELKADHAGTITEEHAQTGQNVAAGQTVYTLAWGDGKDVVVDVPESRIGEVALQQSAQIRLHALPKHTFQARVREIAAAADPVSRTFRVKMALDGDSDKKGTPRDRVRLGMSATAEFVTADRDSLTLGEPPVSFVIPVTALFHQESDPAVWVLDPTDDTLHLRTVQVHEYGREHVLISGGLTEGERVLARGAHTVSEGQRVMPVDDGDKSQP